MDWKSIVGTVAPTIATALGGPLAGLAVKAIGGAFGLGEGASEKEVAAAVVGASPEQLLALKNADQEFAVRMRELDIDLERIAAEDRASARQREAATGDSLTPRVLAVAITLGFFAVLGLMLFRELPAQGRDALLIMLGSLGTSWAAVVAYYFGSSVGSKSKDQTLAALKR